MKSGRRQSSARRGGTLPKDADIEQLIENAKNYTYEELRDKLEEFTRIPVSDRKYNYYTHAARNPDDIDSILEHGLDPNKVQNSVVFASQGIVRDREAGYVVFRVPKNRPLDEGIDFVETGLTYPEFYVRERVPPSDIVRVVRSVPLSGWPPYQNADVIVRYALDNQGLPRTDQNVADLPSTYQKLFNLREITS